VLYEDLPQAIRLELHRDLARALAAAGAPAVHVAEHFVRAGGLGGREAARWLRRAAREEAPRAPAVAADLLEQALALADPQDPDRDQLLAERAENLLWSGRSSETEAICRQVLASGTGPTTEAQLRQLLMSSLFTQSRNTEAQQEAELAARVQRLPLGERAVFVASGSWGRLMLGDLEGAAREAARALTLSERAGGDPRAVVRALQTLTFHARLHGRFREGLGYAQRAIQAADQSPQRTGHRLPLHMWRALLLIELDRFSECQQAVAHGRRLSEKLGVTWNLPLYHFAAGSGHWWAGAWDDAAAEYRAGLELAEELSGGWRLGDYGMLALIALHRDDLAGAEQLLATAEEHLAQTGPQPGLHLVRWPRALLLEVHGRPEEALGVLAETWDSVPAGDRSMCPVLGPDLVRLALALGDRVRAEAVSATAEEVARVNGSAGLRGVAELCRGLVTGRPELLVAAAEFFGQSGRPFQRARACELAGRAAAAAGRVEEARRLLEAALELHEGLQATREAARVEANLRGLGVRRGRRGTRRRPKLGWESLTETERRVTELVAEGLSNPQIAERMFLSRRTVQTHVSHILAKLEMSSRVELAAAAARRGS
jgi:DNA-binding CsgD family transcriptional regulator